MSSPQPGARQNDEDDPMLGSGNEDEGEGEELAPGLSDDSSEEEEEDADEEKRIRDGFIVDEDEDEEDEPEQESHRKKRRKRRHRRREEEQGLEDDDLDLLEENTGASFQRRSRLTRLRRGRDSESPPAVVSSKRRHAVDLSDDDLNNEEDIPRVQDIQDIWDDAGRDDDLDSFIESDDEEGGDVLDEHAKAERRKEKKRQEFERRKTRRAHPELAGIDANAWEEIHEVFGHGDEYDWALERDEEMPDEEPKTKMNEVFEPTDIQSRFLTDDDDLIRVQDIPERMQLATSTLTLSSSLALHHSLSPDEIPSAAMWVCHRLSARKSHEFFNDNGQHIHLQPDLVMAVTFVLQQLFIEKLEVPHLWTHRRDHLAVVQNRTRTELLSLPELWKIHSLGQKFRSLLSRRQTLENSYERLNIQDEYFEEDLRSRLETVEMVADTTEWLQIKHKNDKKNDLQIRFFDDAEAEPKRHKMPSRQSNYTTMRTPNIVRLVKQGFGMEAYQIVRNFYSEQRIHFPEDNDLNPLACADQFGSPDFPEAPEDTMSKARMVLAIELGKDPQLRQAMRDLFKQDAYISVEPTPRGVAKIDEFHPYFNFKYLAHKNVKDMLESPQFLSILAAERELLVTVTVTLDPDSKATFERSLNDAMASDSFSESAKAWNEERSRVVRDVLEQHLIPAGVKWIREYLREEVEDWGAGVIGAILRSRIDVGPFKTDSMSQGQEPCVVAMSWGRGDPQKDAIAMVYLGEQGLLRDKTQIDNLVDTETRDEFMDFIRRRKPDVLVVGGLTVSTYKLTQRVRDVLNENQHYDLPVIYVNDSVARIYQHSKRADLEHGGLSTNMRYCIGLARFTQNPLLEYASLGPDITAIAFEENIQHLIPNGKLLSAIERTLVDVTNKVGLDINRAVLDQYYRRLLPFVCGLGPRKADALVKRISDVLGGTVINRHQFIRSGLLTTKLFLNAAGFLRIAQDDQDKHRNHADIENAPDPLDDTRVHPEDYELARKMATDALELDEEDVHGEHPSSVVTSIMQDRDAEKKLSDLNLDEFAISLFEANGDKKRHTLTVIRDELCHPFRDERSPVRPLERWEILTMLSGESIRTLDSGILLSVSIVRITKEGLFVRLDSGVEGLIPENHNGNNFLYEDVKPTFSKAQTLRAVVVSTDFPTDDTVQVILTARPHDIESGRDFHLVAHDPCWDSVRYDKDQDMQQRKKRAEINRTRRVIKHPNFHNFNTAQAEAHLDRQQRGDVVIRPSSKGPHHLAVTWKVDEDLYQHIDVTDANPDPTGQNVGTLLIVDATHSYADLDELIVNHIQAMSRRVEELVAHERFKSGNEDDLHMWLKNRLKADPGKSMYGFTLNRKRPGHFSLCFLANQGSTVQTWPVRVAPEAYYLFEAAAVGVPELCDAFKVRHLHQSQNMANAAAGGKTPYGAGGRTPGRLGGATPGHASVRQVARTPNPYGGATPRAGYGGASATYASATPTYGGATPRMPPPSGVQSFGGATPHFAAPPPPEPASSIPRGMNPARAAMMQQSQQGGWGSGGGAW